MPTRPTVDMDAPTVRIPAPAITRTGRLRALIRGEADRQAAAAQTPIPVVDGRIDMGLAGERSAQLAAAARLRAIAEHPST